MILLQLSQNVKKLSEHKCIESNCEHFPVSKFWNIIWGQYCLTKKLLILTHLLGTISPHNYGCISAATLDSTHDPILMGQPLVNCS